jgi:TolA-binding protein
MSPSVESNLKLVLHAPFLKKGAWLFFAILLSTLTSSSASAQSKPTDPSLSNTLSNTLANAEEAYENGDCKTAIKLYEPISQNKTLAAETQSLAVFRIAYCHYSNGEAELAEKNFRKYLKLFPKDEEARLRYAESLFQQGKWTTVIQDTQRSQGSWSKSELDLLIGRSYLELRAPETAIRYFATIPAGSAMDATATYWRAVAHYQRGDRRAARIQFDHARQIKNAPEWIREYSNDWIRQIKQELSWLQGSLTLGYFYDGNLGFTSSQSVNPTTGQPLLYAPNESSYIKDHGFLINPRLYGTLFERHPFSMSYELEATKPFYLNNHSYENETLSASLSMKYILSSRLKLGLESKYLDSRYHYLYYQDFLSFNPNASFSIDRKWNVSIAIPYTLYRITRNLTLISPSVNARYQITPNLNLNAGINLSVTSGEKATYTATSPAYVSTGTMFSNSTALGANLGMGIQLPKGFYFSAQAGIYSTKYAAESAGVSGTAQARSDQLLLYSADLYFDWIKDSVGLDLSYSQFTNTSRGFQGIAYDTTMSTYNYKRPYVLFSTQIRF